MTPSGPTTKRMPAWNRILIRYFVPRLVASLWILWRDRAFVSLSSRVQLGGLIRLGRGTVVKPYSIIQTAGGRISIGAGCAISSFNHISAGDVPLVMGDHVRTGPHVTIVATTREYSRRDQLIVDQGFKDKGITIGNDVLIGAHAVILDGCDIGDGAVIGVGSIVSGKVAPYDIVFGGPAKKVFARR